MKPLLNVKEYHEKYTNVDDFKKRLDELTCFNLYVVKTRIYKNWYESFRDDVEEFHVEAVDWGSIYHPDGKTVYTKNDGWTFVGGIKLKTVSYPEAVTFLASLKLNTSIKEYPITIVAEGLALGSCYSYTPTTDNFQKDFM